MRQVKPKRSPRTAAVRSSGRVKTVRERAPAPRASRRKKDEPKGMFGALGNTFIGRHAMLSLTLGLIAVACIGGLAASGRISKTFSTIGTSIDRAFAGAGLAVGRITIAGQARTDAADIYAAAAITQGESMVAVDPRAVRTRLMQLPWVHDAAVKRVYPDTIAITVIEKLPFTLWKHDGHTAVLERSGAPITTADPAEFTRLPILVGEGAPETAAPLLDAIGATRAVAARLKGLERVSNRRWNLILDGPVEVKLPEEGWEQQLQILEKMIVEQGVLERDIQIIDLRFADRYIFQLRNGDSHESPRGRPT
jgi:cell division protein FtsQ